MTHHAVKFVFHSEIAEVSSPTRHYGIIVEIKGLVLQIHVVQLGIYHSPGASVLNSVTLATMLMLLGVDFRDSKSVFVRNLVAESIC